MELTFKYRFVVNIIVLNLHLYTNIYVFKKNNMGKSSSKNSILYVQ